MTMAETTTTTATNGHRLAQRPVSELLSRFADDTSTLLGQEVELAKAEIRHEVKKATTGAAMFGGAIALAMAGLGALTATAILALSEGMPAWLAALIVAVVLLAVGGVAAMMGKKRVQDISPPVPDRALEGVRADVTTVTEGLGEGRDEARREREAEEALRG
jgi:uncharacterized membrane protein YqjE